MKRKLDINRKKVMDDQGGEAQSPELEIDAVEKVRAPPELTDGANGGRGGDLFPADDQEECEQSLTDRDINEQIERQKALLINLGHVLPDKGKKIRVEIKRLEAEKQRRMLRRPRMDVEGCEKHMQFTTAGPSGLLREDNAAIEGDKCNGEMSQRQQGGGQSASRQIQFQYSGKCLPDGCKSNSSDGDSTPNTSSDGDSTPKGLSPCSLLVNDDKIISQNTSRKTDSEVSPSYNTRHGKRLRQTVINVDEEDNQRVTTSELVDELPEGLKEDIYYPSRDDPEFVQVCSKDMECLSPEGYLTSNIMNFYIRYLRQQASLANQAVFGCHFFSTYFYKKLKEAVSYKGNGKDAFFVKFRRWWKGINLFQKAYILIPIHEDAHWSLVIICIPDKESETGPVILHLDSLRFHVSRSIFVNVKRFLVREWKYLNQNGASPDVPISDKIWSKLPRRISDKQIEVPQQKNEYDCGLFVLFFMERFIEMAPERLKRKDLEMFGKKWFKPEQASALRWKIHSILVDLFKCSSREES